MRKVRTTHARLPQQQEKASPLAARLLVFTYRATGQHVQERRQMSSEQGPARSCQRTRPLAGVGEALPPVFAARGAGEKTEGAVRGSTLPTAGDRMICRARRARRRLAASVQRWDAAHRNAFPACQSSDHSVVRGAPCAAGEASNERLPMREKTRIPASKGHCGCVPAGAHYRLDGQDCASARRVPDRYCGRGICERAETRSEDVGDADCVVGTEGTHHGDSAR
jgi:hypothetical protein